MNNETERSALLVMDVQQGIVERLPNKDEDLANITTAIVLREQNKFLLSMSSSVFALDFRK